MRKESLRKASLAAVPLVLAACLAVPRLAAADAIRLKNGNVLEVEAWRDVGDAIEFASGGGIVRIAKSEVARIEGRPTRSDLKMYTSGVSTSTGGGAALDQTGAVAKMKDLLGQSDGLFAQAVLSATEKAGAFRRLGEKWREFEVPEPLRDAHTRGQTALDLAADAFTAEASGADPDDARERVQQARREVQAVQDEVNKLAGSS